MRSTLRALAVALAMVPALALGQTSTWSIDPVHSRASFAVKHLVVSNVRGELGKVTGTITLDEKDVTKSSVEATIDVTGIDTREAKRDDDLRSANFFDVAKYPTLTFKSTKVERAGKDGLKVTGDLTMHGVTKPIVLEVSGPSPAMKDPWGMTRRGAAATAKLNRQDYGVAFNALLEGGGAVVGNEVKIDIDVEFTKK